MLTKEMDEIFEEAISPLVVKSDKATKTWLVSNLANSRHPQMDGETVPLESRFSNGLLYPGAWGNSDESAGCRCSMSVNLPDVDPTAVKRATIWEILQYVLGLKTLEEVVGPERSLVKHIGPTLGRHFHPHVGPFDKHGSLITYVNESGEMFTGEKGKYTPAATSKVSGPSVKLEGPVLQSKKPRIFREDAEPSLVMGEILKDFDRDGMSTDEETAIQEYVGNGYAHINGPLRDHSIVKPELDPKIHYVDTAIEHGTFSEDTVIWRGFGTGKGLQLKEGLEFEDAGFTSFSLQKYQAEQFAGITSKDGKETGNVVRIVAPKGSHFAVGSESESELILPRGLKYRVGRYVEDDSEQGGYWELELITFRSQNGDGTWNVDYVPRGVAQQHVITKSSMDVPKPMLLTETRDLVNSTDWIYQKKYDGQRALIKIKDGKVEVFSRTHQNLTDKYPSLQNLASDLHLDPTGEYILDGELVAFDDQGRADIDLLQQTRKKDGSGDTVPVRYVAFDVIESNGEDVTGRSLEERLGLLHSIMPENESQYVMEAPTSANGEDLLAETQRRGEEGVVAKRKGSLYTAAQRSKDWVKVKNYKQSEVVVAGWEEGKGERAGHVGSLLMGVYRSDGSLRYVGSIGSGISGETLAAIEEKLSDKGVGENPFDAESEKLPRGVHFVKPILVITAEFTDLTDKGLLRQPKIVQIREDKKAPDATMEQLLNVANPPDLMQESVDAKVLNTVAPPQPDLLEEKWEHHTPLTEDYEDWKASLSEEDRKWYDEMDWMAGWSKINNFKRSGKDGKFDFVGDGEKILASEAANRVDRYFDTPVDLGEGYYYRGMDDASIADLEVGSIFRDNGYSFITANPGIAAGFAAGKKRKGSPVLLQIHTLGGEKAIPGVYQELEEGVLPAGTEYIVTGKSTEMAAVGDLDLIGEYGWEREFVVITVEIREPLSHTVTGMSDEELLAYIASLKPGDPNYEDAVAEAKKRGIWGKADAGPS